VAVCVPFPYLAQAQAKLAGSAIAWGAQNMSQHAKGAFTGEVSASMLKDFGCKLRHRRPFRAPRALWRKR
jgi:triosephosphate isomerase (TIM)